MRFEVRVNGVRVGHSDLEAGDPPMGVAFGVMRPTEQYAQVQPQFQLAAGAQISEMTVSVAVVGGQTLPAVGFALSDYSKELGPSGLEVTVLGIDASVYTTLFPAHCEAYERQFPS